MEYVAVLNNYLEYSLDDNHALIFSFQSISMHVFHAAVSIKCCVTHVLNLTYWNLDLIIFSAAFSSFFTEIRTYRKF